MHKEINIKGQSTLVKMSKDEIVKIAKESLKVVKEDKYNRFTEKEKLEEIKKLEETIKAYS